MEFSEADEVDYIVGKSLRAQALESLYPEQAADNSASHRSSSSRASNQFAKQHKQSHLDSITTISSSSVPAFDSNLLKEILEETTDDLISDINSIISSQTESYNKKQRSLEEQKSDSNLYTSRTTDARGFSSFSDTHKLDSHSTAYEHAEGKTLIDSSNQQNVNQNHQNSHSIDKHRRMSSGSSSSSSSSSSSISGSSSSQDSREEMTEPTDATDAFEEVPQEVIMNSFTSDAFKKVSLLKEKSTKVLNGNSTTPALYDNPNMKKIEVYFFCTSFNKKIGIDEHTTVQEFTRTIIEAYLADPESDKSLMRYPKFVQAYELRIRDDESFKPEPNFPPLEPKRIVLSMFVDSIVFLESDKFKPPTINLDDQVQQKARENASEFGQEVLNIDIQNSMKTLVKMDVEKTLKDLIVYLNEYKNQRLLVKESIVHCFNPNDELYEEVDLNMPINQLPSLKLRISKKVWADLPPEVVKPKLPVVESDGVSALRQTMLQSEPISMMNLLKYEEFAVIKINQKGKKQNRIIGIDQQRIQNINKKVKTNSLGFLNRIFLDPQTGTKTPSRLIDDIISITEQEPNMITMKVKEPDTSAEKVIRYIIESEEQRNKIFKKIEGIMDYHRKEQHKRGGSGTSGNSGSVLK